MPVAARTFQLLWPMIIVAGNQGCWQGVGCVTFDKKDDLSDSSLKSELRDPFMTFPVPRPLLHHLRAGEGW